MRVGAVYDYVIGRDQFRPLGTLRRKLLVEAKPGQMLISRRVLAAIEELLEVELAGELSLEGFQRPITA